MSGVPPMTAEQGARIIELLESIESSVDSAAFLLLLIFVILAFFKK